MKTAHALLIGLAAAWLGPSPEAQAQPEPGASRLGPSLGAPDRSGGSQTLPQDESPLGGRAGPSAPRVPSGVTRPGRETAPRAAIGAPAPEAPRAALPLYGALETDGEEPAAPAGGLTLDQAIELLVRNNLSLRSKATEIPKADADILTAGLRANPVLYADSQMIPYQSYSAERPGGPVQYDINITYPLDLTGKREARTAVAHEAKRVVEAQYQDAVRLAIDNLYGAYVDILAARETVRFAKAGTAGLERLLEVVREQEKNDFTTPVEVKRVEIQVEEAEQSAQDAEAALADARFALASLLRLPPEQAETLEVSGVLNDLPPPPPPVEELIGRALAERPDLDAYRLAIGRAKAEQGLAHANRMENVFLMVQPYTFQDNSPFGEKSAHSFAVGVTVPLPLFDRNQGNIARAELSVHQSHMELDDLERRVIGEVQRAERLYQASRRAATRFGQKVVPESRLIRATNLDLFRGGETSLPNYLEAQREFNDAVRLYRDALVQHRRAALRLNTAVGCRIMP